MLVSYMKDGDLDNSLPVIAQALELSQQVVEPTYLLTLAYSLTHSL